MKRYLKLSSFSTIALPIVIFLLLLPGALLAVDIEPQGFVDTYHAVRLRDPYDYLSSRTRLRLEMWVTGEDASLFASMNAMHNNVIPSDSGMELREAFMDYTAEKWDLRTGRQIIIWGKADGLAITDIISPKDYTEFLARDFDDIRLPVDALRGRLLFDRANIEFLWLPVFKPAILPPSGTPWVFQRSFPDNVKTEFDDPIEPDLSLKNSELAGKVSFYLSGIDFAIFAFYTWDDLPTAHRTTTSEDDTTLVHYHPEHHRFTCGGAEFSVPHRDFVLRGETAFCKGRYFEPEDLCSEEIFKRNALNWMIGLDWTPGNDWSVTAQWADNFILDYDQAVKDDEHTMLSTLHISKELFRQTLTLSSMGYFGINEHECFVRSSMDYALTDELHLLLGLDLFFGDEGMMGQYDDNDEVWMKAKVNF
jgi:hypothetical protein